MWTYGRSGRWAVTRSPRTNCSSTICAYPPHTGSAKKAQGSRYILDGLNPERMLVAAEALGLGRAALRRATRYGNEREVFGRPIGMNQGLQFPLADSLARLDAAELVLRKATWLYDHGKPCAGKPTPRSTSAPTPDSRPPTGHSRSTVAWATPRSTTSPGTSARPDSKIAPLSQEMVLNFLGSHGLGLPRSY